MHYNSFNNTVTENSYGISLYDHPSKIADYFTELAEKGYTHVSVEGYEESLWLELIRPATPEEIAEHEFKQKELDIQRAKYRRQQYQELKKEFEPKRKSKKKEE